MRFSALFHSLLMCIAISSVTLTFTSVAQAQTGNRVEIAEGTLGNGNPTDSEHQKNGRVSCVPLNRIAIEALRYLAEFRSENCPDARYVFCNREGTGIESMMRSFATACDNAGIEKIRFIRDPTFVFLILTALAVSIRRKQQCNGHRLLVERLEQTFSTRTPTMPCQRSGCCPFYILICFSKYK